MAQTVQAAESVRDAAALAAWRAARGQAHAQFLAKRKIGPLWRGLSEAMDTYIAALAQKGETRFAVVAVGGYGRGQLFPHSDIDVLVVTKDAEATDAIEHVLYGLWDTQMAVGHAVRSIEEALEAARGDHTIMAAMLDMRFIAGDKALATRLMRRVARELIGSDPLKFVEAKLNERDRRHDRALDSRLVLEPNVKEGKGGLRDLHTIWWLARYCYDVKRIGQLTRGPIFTEEDAKHYDAALDFLATVRASLHLAYGRAEERLTFDAQLLLAQAYHYRKSGEEAAKRFMKHYFYHATRVGELTRSFCTLLEEEKKRPPSSRLARWLAVTPKYGRFVREGERLSVESAKAFRDDPLLMVELFATAQERGLDIHPHALKAMRLSLGRLTKKHRTSERAAAAFFQILLSEHVPHITLRRMSEAGLLARLIPEFAGIEGQMQYDRYHTYTVDEHTLKAIEALQAVERGELQDELPISTAIASQVQSRRALYMAMLTHDIGKGAGSQAERGEALSAEIARRMQMSEGEIKTVAWLVRHHLLMSEVAFKRDLDDPKTIEDFVAAVQSPERLRLLLLITVADIRAVGPHIWNGWKGALLRDLYHRALARMGGAEAPVDVTGAKLKLAQHLRLNHSGWTQASIDTFVGMIAPPAFWSRSAAEQEAMAMLYKRYQASREPALAVTEDTFRAITDLTLCLRNHALLLQQVAGVAALMGASIVSAKLIAAHDDTTWVKLGLQDVTGAAFDAGKAMREFPKLYHKVQSGALELQPELERTRPNKARVQQAAFVEPPRVLIDNALSATHTVIEVNGTDRIGFLHDIAAALVESGLVIATAHVATYGTRAVDVFYVKDAYGHRVVHPGRREKVVQAVLSAIDGRTA